MKSQVAQLTLEEIYWCSRITTSQGAPPEAMRAVPTSALEKWMQQNRWSQRRLSPAF